MGSWRLLFRRWTWDQEKSHPMSAQLAWPGPAAAPDGYMWYLMDKTGQVELLLFKDEVWSVEITPSLVYTYRSSRGGDNEVFTPSPLAP